MNLSRRGFLAGLLASAAAAPVVARAAVAPALPPIFSGEIGIYNGVIIREVESFTLDHLMRAKQAMGSAVIRATPEGYYVAYVSPRSPLAELLQYRGVRFVPEQEAA
jgi:hypothetical protein